MKSRKTSIRKSRSKKINKSKKSTKSKRKIVRKSVRKSVKNMPKNKKLYKETVEKAKKIYKKWPSAYASAWVAKEYKKQGGTYTGRKNSRSGITRWLKEEWINVCKLPKKIPCGRSKLSAENWKKKYPYCRPSKKITSKTPVLASKLKKSQIKKLCKRKRKSPMKRIIL
jgi:hypothetical protein